MNEDLIERLQQELEAVGAQTELLDIQQARINTLQKEKSSREAAAKASEAAKTAAEEEAIAAIMQKNKCEQLLREERLRSQELQKKLLQEATQRQQEQKSNKLALGLAHERLHDANYISQTQKNVLQSRIQSLQAQQGADKPCAQNSLAASFLSLLSLFGPFQSSSTPDAHTSSLKRCASRSSSVFSSSIQKRSCCSDKARAEEPPETTLARRNRLWRRMVDATPLGFELCCGAMLETMGFRIAHQGKIGDHGIDLKLRKAGLVSVAQCKRYLCGKVGEAQIREFYGVMCHEAASKGFFVTTSCFTKQARVYADSVSSMVLWDKESLLELLLERGEDFEKRLTRMEKKRELQKQLKQRNSKIDQKQQQ